MSTAHLLSIPLLWQGLQKNKVLSNNENPIQITSKDTTETQTQMYCFGDCEYTWNSQTTGLG